LFDKQSDRKTAGIVLILIGIVFLLPKIFFWINTSGLILPLLIIAGGIAIIVRATTRKKWFGKSTFKTHFVVNEENITVESEGYVRKDYIFSGSKEKWKQGKLKNLEIEAVFSGVELDLTQAEVLYDVDVATRIKITAVFSGVILYVPEDWNITILKTGVFGGFVDSRPNRVLQSSGNKLVVLELEAVFGGGEIKCYE
jgi:predicted membrane protein